WSCGQGAPARVRVDAECLARTLDHVARLGSDDFEVGDFQASADELDDPEEALALRIFERTHGLPRTAQVSAHHVLFGVGDDCCSRAQTTLGVGPPDETIHYSSLEGDHAIVLLIADAEGPRFLCERAPVSDGVLVP